ncbi:uncharacterized protein [Bemisia tabaci]|uniref:uncharacterized protein n=1 Tax=Bemisia tabaci TaxID=7038 RepID=UPI003B28AB1C
MAQSDYLQRHNQVCNILHQNLAMKYELINKQTPYYKYTPEVVLENDKCKLYYDRTVITDKTAPHNIFWPDIILVNKSQRTAYLMDIAIPNNHNLQKTQQEKIERYVELGNEIKAMWKLQEVRIVPIVISNTGVPTKLSVALVRQLEVQENIMQRMQKAVILSTCNMVRKFLSL